jgi:hypothetical protein
MIAPMQGIAKRGGHGIVARQSWKIRQTQIWVCSRVQPEPTSHCPPSAVGLIVIAMSSFQHFRLSEMAMAQPLPPHLMQNQHQPNQQGPQFQTPVTSASPAGSSSRAPYGSGDHDDGYSLIFPSLAAFHAWREHEEETQMVEFVKGDTHGSKAVPPRFKDHTKLVCARHSRSGRKKYVKKHPERVRKVPSRKVRRFDLALKFVSVCL